MTVLKLDYDWEQSLVWFPVFQHRLRLLHEIMGYTVETWFPAISKGGKWHVRLELKEELEDVEVLVLQLFLGSDPVRELYNLRRVKNGQVNWNILFASNTVSEKEEVKK